MTTKTTCALLFTSVIAIASAACGGPEAMPNARAPEGAATTTQGTPAAAGDATPPSSHGAPATPAPSSDGPSATSGAATPPPMVAGGKEQLGDLEWKRMHANITSDLPKHKDRFKQLCGGAVEVEIDWASLGREKATLEAFWSNYGVERLVASFESVCHDKLGKEAVQKKVKKIRAVNVKDPAKVKVTLSGGTMTAELNWSSGTAPGMNESEIAAAITKQL
ncbi:MAG: hypothetical protein JST00_03380 [Deltaproteobacteria bacterium]|nr:hypothetical protein [Deltaproteobacteria bacterium]